MTDLLRSIERRLAIVKAMLWISIVLMLALNGLTWCLGERLAAIGAKVGVP